MRKAKSITYKVEMPEKGTDEYRRMYIVLQQAGMSTDTAARVLAGVNNLTLGYLVKVAAAFGLNTLDELIAVEWEDIGQ